MEQAMKREVGSVGNLMATGICILAMTVVMLSFMQCVALIQQKTGVNQLARKYILKMETVGFLTGRDQTLLCGELEQLGVEDIRLDESTLQQVNYGDPITLTIQGTLKGGYTFVETRASTAKN